jgi:hypothetical protein
MTLKDLFTHWEESVQHALAAQLSSAQPQDEALLSTAGLAVRSGVIAGGYTFPQCTYGCT